MPWKLRITCGCWVFPFVTFAQTLLFYFYMKELFKWDRREKTANNHRLIIFDHIPFVLFTKITNSFSHFLYCLHFSMCYVLYNLHSIRCCTEAFSLVETSVIIMWVWWHSHNICFESVGHWIYYNWIEQNRNMWMKFLTYINIIQRNRKLPM